MKKILYLLSIVVLGSLVASCNINDLPKFDNKDAFVSFPQGTMAIAEDGATLKIPVSLTSLGGTATITYEFVDGTAKAGIDYADASDAAAAGTLTFAAGESLKEIPVTIIAHTGTFTGDLTFSVKFKSTGDTKPGAVTECKVTINDLDHPLGPILGDYACSGTDGWGDPLAWTMGLSKDATDLTKVWFFNIFAVDSWADWDTIYYGIADMANNKITIPLGQESEYLYGGTTPVSLYGCDGAGMITTGDMVVVIADSGATLKWDTMAPWARIEGAGNLNIILPGFTCTKIVD